MALLRRTLAAVVLGTLSVFAQPAYDAELSSYPYPFPVGRYTISAQGQKLSMAYMDVKPTSPNGQTVLLLHGKNFSGAYWENTAALLSQKGYRVIVPDQVGFGKSSKPASFQYSFHEMARHTDELLRSLQGEQPTHVVAHSMGGMLGVRYALMHPQRVRSLTLVNPIGLEDWKRSVPYRSVAQSYAAELKATPESVRTYMRESYFGGDWKPEYDKLVDVQAGWTRGPDKERIAWTSALTSDMVFTQPVVHEFPDLKVPVLLIIGQRDRTAIGKAWAAPDVKARLGNYPQLGVQAQKAIPGAELVSLPESGHLPQVEQFEAYSRALLDYLQRH